MHQPCTCQAQRTKHDNGDAAKTAKAVVFEHIPDGDFFGDGTSARVFANIALGRPGDV